jgi:formylglycine-generating enzyme
MKKLYLLLCFSAVTHFVVSQTNSNSIGMKFELIHPGTMVIGEFQPPYPVPNDTVKSLSHDYTMWMGDGRTYNKAEFEEAKQLALRDARQGFSVAIDKPFYIGTTEVTQGQWRKVMGYNPSQFQKVENADSLPVESVTWRDAQKFIKKLNRLEKTNRYRLPSEFEWEYAARGGATKDIPWAEIDVSANLNKKNTIKVGRKKANAYGLYDMLGNVWEWVADPYNEKLFADRLPKSKGKQHVLKGASFTGDVKNATYMTHAGGPGNGFDVGFRVVKDVE